MKFADIPQFTQMGNYNVNVGWKYLEQHLSRWGEDYGLELDPDFQRAHVWTEEKQRKYVEFILRGGHSSKVLYWNCAGWDNLKPEKIYLVDGKQRLEAVRKFLRNELKVFGHHYNEFEDSLRLVRNDFIFNVNNLPNRKAVLQWYLDLNSGGVVHTEDELEKVRKLLEKEK